MSLMSRAAALVWRIERRFTRAAGRPRAPRTARLRGFVVLAAFSLAFVSLGVGATRVALRPSGMVDPIDRLAAQARADLVDRHGALLATDLPVYGLYFDPRENWDLDEVRRRLATVRPDLPLARINRALMGDHRTYVAGNLAPADRAAIDDLGLPGLSFEEERRRVYPLATTAAHLIGFSQRGGPGIAGAELALDSDIVARAAGGQVPLAMDLRVQSALDDELAAAAQKFSVHGAVGIVTNVHTGEILALSSWPRFDPNSASSATPDALINHAAATVYEPGSVFKVFTVAMGLDAKIATINSVFDARAPLRIGGQVIHDYDKDNALLPLWEVFTHSSNIGAARLGLLAGPDLMRRYFRSFGLFDAAAVELRETAKPILPRTLTPNAIASMSFGSAISVSPLAIAAGMDAVLNGGEYLPLTIRPHPAHDRPEGRRVISKATSRTMLALMRLNVLQGTGAKAGGNGYRVGGKTGSQEKVIDGRYDRHKLVSSFAAVFPTDGPLASDRYLVLIMLDEPHATADTFGFATGGWTAAPVAGRVIARIAPDLGVSRSPLPRTGV